MHALVAATSFMDAFVQKEMAREGLAGYHSPTLDQTQARNEQ